MTFPHDPEFPYLVVNVNNYSEGKFFRLAAAELFLCSGLEGYGRVVDTTPPPIIPKDAEYLAYEGASGERHMARLVNGTWWYTDEDEEICPEERDTFFSKQKNVRKLVVEKAWEES